MNFTGGLQMKPKSRSLQVLGTARSKAKMFEYSVPEDHHIKITRDPSRLFSLAIGMLGDLAAHISSKDIDLRDRAENQKELIFSAQFFDAYLESHRDKIGDPYLLLLGSAAYYLCDLPGSSKVMINRLAEIPDLEGLGLEYLLFWLLRGDFSSCLQKDDEYYGELIYQISYHQAMFCKSGSGKEELFAYTHNLRREVYQNGTPRQLLFADIAVAIIKKRYDNSTWICLPEYTNIASIVWAKVIQQKRFIKELWPAQHLLGKCGIYKGKSAVIQMPTSAGKTKATEIIIRSAFLSDRTKLAVIVAPFRALCHEIRDDLVSAFSDDEEVDINELSDVLQADFGENSFHKPQILITTPEKLVYVIRHSPAIAERIGLLIYDEGHQFDSGTRGVTYELLLSSLKRIIPEDAQTLLISAVISNAEDIDDWLNEGNGVVVSGTNLTPTNRSVAFISWVGSSRYLQFVNYNNPEEEEFYVPKIIESYSLALRGKERNPRLFPERDDSKSISLYLGLKVVHNGGVAIFCGTKISASAYCEHVVDVFSRGLPMNTPASISNKEEIHKLVYLYECNLGSDVYSTRSAALGVLTHHANVPHGIRIAVEHSLKEGLAKFVICTSTLAQGVNLPIRYLIVSSVYQGGEKIKVRDFHNLIGRAGRSGKYTEGSILFADPKIYDGKEDYYRSWRWSQIKELLNPLNSEPCASALLTIFKPLKNTDGSLEIQLDPLELAEKYVNNINDLLSYPDLVLEVNPNGNFSKEDLLVQINWKISIISAIESFLMSQWGEHDEGLSEGDVEALANSTLAYHLADDENKQALVDLFLLLTQNVGLKMQNPQGRKVFGRTLYGVYDSLIVQQWVSENVDAISACDEQDELLCVLWPLIAKFIKNSTFKKCHPEEGLLEMAIAWIEGEPYSDLLVVLADSGATIGVGLRPRNPTIDHVVDICGGGFAFDGTLLIGAVCEFMQLLKPDDNATISELLELQKRFKYGLSSVAAITLYEMGFSDRVIAMELSEYIKPRTRTRALKLLKNNFDQIKEIIEKYPSYYLERLLSLVSNSR